MTAVEISASEIPIIPSEFKIDHSLTQTPIIPSEIKIDITPIKLSEFKVTFGLDGGVMVLVGAALFLALGGICIDYIKGTQMVSPFRFLLLMWCHNQDDMQQTSTTRPGQNARD